MNDQLSTPATPSTTHTYYTCWPILWGGWLCGACFVGLGAGLLLQSFFPQQGDLIWGALLISLGAVVLANAAKGPSRA